MITYGEIIEKVRTPYAKGASSDDIRLRPRYIIGTALGIRSLLIKQDYDKRSFTRMTTQRVNCMKLIEATRSECPCEPSDLGCKILRTKEQIPSPIYDKLFTVTTPDGNDVYNPTTFSNVRHKAFSRLKVNQNASEYYVSNQYLYVITKGFPSHISFEGIFENPDEIDRLNSVSCGKSPSLGCVDMMNVRFPIEKYLEEAVIDLTYGKIMERWNKGKEDNSNNTKSNNLDRENEGKENQTL